MKMRNQLFFVISTINLFVVLNFILKLSFPFLENVRNQNIAINLLVI